MARQEKLGLRERIHVPDWALNLLMICAAVYVLGFLALTAFQRDLIFKNENTRIAPEQTEAPEMVEATVKSADGTNLIVWAGGGKNNDSPVILYFHGNSGALGHRASRFRWFIDQGWSVVAMAYRGSGGSEGIPGEEEFTADSSAIYAALPRLLGRDVKPAQVVLYGESLGTGVALALAERRPVGGVMLETPYTSMEDLVHRVMPIYPMRATGMLQHRFANIERIDRINAPLLIMHGAENDVVELEQAQTLMERANDPKWARWYPDGGHRNLWQVGAKEEISGFMGMYFSK